MVKKAWKRQVLIGRPEKSENGSRKPNIVGTRKYLEKTLESKTVKTMLIAVDSFEEESAEIPYAELVKDDYAEVCKKIANFVGESFAVGNVARKEFILVKLTGKRGFLIK